MKLQPIGMTQIAWPVLFSHVPDEVGKFDASGTNLRCVDGFLKLLSSLDNTDNFPDYLLDHWSWIFYYELPYDVVTELSTKSRIKILNVPMSRSDIDRGFMTGTLAEWRDFVQTGSTNGSKDFLQLSKIIRLVFERENLNSLLRGL